MTQKEQVVSLMLRLQNIGCRIWAEDDKLRIRTSKNALTSELKQEIQTNKADILAFLNAAKARTVMAEEIPTLTDDVPKLLSFAQQRLWLLAQLQGSSASYNIPIALQLDGNLNIDALRSSLAYLLNRHASLRMYFPTVAGEPQVALQSLDEIEVLKVLYWQNLDEHPRSPTVQRFINAHAQQAFDLNTGSLFKATLLQFREQKSVLLINMHHIISDGWSMGVFVRELQQAYTDFTQNQTPNLAPLSIQYTDYANWQRNWLQGEVLQNQVNYWKNQLQDAPPLLELPTDYPRPPKQSYRGARYTYSLTPELTNSIKTFSQHQGASLFMTLLAALNILLSRYSRQNDLCIGSPIANRTHSQTEGLIGFFVNTLVLRTQIKPKQSFIEFFQQIRSSCLDAFAHQDIPFEYLVEQLKPERSMSHNPLFQVMFALENNESSSLSLPGLEVEWLDTNYPAAKFDLTLLVIESDNKLSCSWEYATDLFEKSTIQRMAEQFEVLLHGIVDNPEQPISTLPMLTAAELLQIQRWNQTQTDYPHTQTLVDLFEQQVAKTPDNIAANFESQQLTYQQLNEQANQLAHYLIQNHQIKPDTLIGICVERSLEMIIALLGILKAGGAYVPLDPSYPQERLAHMLCDSQVSLLLTTEKLATTLPKHPVHVVCLDTSWPVIAQQSTQNPITEATAANLAYVIYTSGSTGKPKGVMIEHKGLCNLAQAQIQTFGLHCDSRILQFASLSFDASVSEIIMALGSGGTLYLATKDSLLPGRALIQLLSDYSITHITLPPSALAVLPHEELPALQTIIVAGEACSIELIKQWSVGRDFFNAYGPTEATVCATIAKCTNSEQKISIGSPIANTQIYLLDQNLQPVPVGVPGELYIAGAGLARGYLNRSELTAEKFISLDLLGKRERVYKTGDSARWLPDGNLEYLGRIDNQVKLRGFRIELGEIEALLAKHSKIRQAVVIVQGEEPIDKRLLAYIVPTPTDNNLENQSFQAEQVELWQQVFNDSYHRQQTLINDPTLNLAGWNDSYTGKPIPQAAMQEWRDTTVAQILELEPKWVWEIGCGTGMLLFKVAPHCQHYLGTDFSLSALQYIEQHLEEQSLKGKVSLKNSAAHQFEGIETNAYDLVILNSVIQYFPSLDYLLEVLEGVVKAVATHGAIFIGDVRNLLLLDAFHTSVEFYRGFDELSIEDLRQQIQKSIRTEEELLIDPDFFIALKKRFPRISQVHIQLKRGYAQTEMSRFRYDVILYLDHTDIPLAEPKWLDWQSDRQLNLETIEELLTTQQPDLLAIKDIPNARLTLEMSLLEQISQSDGTVKDLKAAAAEAELGAEPEAFRVLTRDLPYTPFIQYSPTKLSNYNVIFQRHSPGQVKLPRFATTDNVQLKPWQDYANQPLQYRTEQVDPALLDEWRDFLRKNLPEYMIPSHFIILEKLPLTPNGKIDRKALPAPETAVTSTDLELPLTSTEKLLAQLWAKLLKYEPIARYDNFFNLGGHSLLATQLVARIRDNLRVEVPLGKVFEFPTLNELANYLDTCIWVNSSTPDMEPLNSNEEEFEL